MRGARYSISAVTLACWLALGLAGMRGGAARAEPLAAPAPSYRIIVHPQNPSSGVPRAFIAEAFLKKRTRWPTGEVIRPVDLPLDAPARRQA